MTENKELFSALDALLSKTDIQDVTSESTGFSELEDGYYLVEVDKAELTTSKSSGNPMASFQLTIVEDGTHIEFGEDKSIISTKIKSSKGRKIFLHYVLKDEQSIKRFVTDMLKFEGDVVGKPLLEKEYFANSELLSDALSVLVGKRIYAQVSTTTKDDKTNVWTNLVSWKRVGQLDLPQ